MATFVPPFEPSSIASPSQVLVTLPDPGRAPGDPVLRPGVARHAGVTMAMLDATPSTGPFALMAPATGPVRHVALPAGGPGALADLLELSPLPFAAARTLRSFSAGVPTFYLGLEAPSSLADDDLVAAGDVLDTVTTHAYIGVCFGDRTCLAPWSWIDTVGEAMTAALEPDAGPWLALAGRYVGARHVRVLDHVGRPANNRTIDVRITPAGGSVEGPFAVTLPAAPADADLEAAVAAAPIVLSRGAQSTLFAASSDTVEVKWTGDALPGDVPLAVHAVYETGDSAKPDEFLALPAGRTAMHLTTIDVSRWFAPRPTNQGTSTLPRWVGDSRVEPMVDGVRVFKRLVDDMLAATGAGNGAHFAGWAVKDFPLDPDRLDSSGTAVDTSLTTLARHIRDGGGGTRVLATRFITLKRSPDTGAQQLALTGLYLGVDLLLIADALGLADTNTVGFLVAVGGTIAATAVIPELLSVANFARDFMERSMEILPVLNTDQPSTALWVPHPATAADNPVYQSLPLGLDTFVDRFGAWHQKIQVVKHPADAAGDQVVAYIGGIDLSPSRRDAPGHQVGGPFHDVQARVTGPAVALVAATWDERWQFHQTDVLTSAPTQASDFDHLTLTDRPPPASATAPAFPPPAHTDASLLPARDARHLVSMGRTYFENAGGPSPLGFAPDGERTTHETLLRAIESARDYIYIEDQYFTPEASVPRGSAPTYFDALLDAAASCRRLLVIVPAENDQPFGDVRRRALFAALSAAWEDRVLIGAVFRRPTLADPGRVASAGRLRLLDGMTPTSDRIIVGPAARVPLEVPFWVWVEGELMVAHVPPSPTTINENPAMELSVLRVTTTADRWGATARSHGPGAAVTLSQLRSIYVHSKTTVIDDMFLSTGSTNVNRRGFFHDGESSIFVIPEQLHAAPDNPARQLRRALWAEHLGLPDRMSTALLSDPIDAFELFRRPGFAGNRFRPFAALDVKAHLSIPTTDGLLGQTLRAIAFTYAASEIPVVWNDVSDPTSGLDPQATPGP